MKKIAQHGFCPALERTKVVLTKERIDRWSMLEILYPTDVVYQRTRFSLYFMVLKCELTTLVNKSTADAYRRFNDKELCEYVHLLHLPEASGTDDSKSYSDCSARCRTEPYIPQKHEENEEIKIEDLRFPALGAAEPKWLLAISYYELHIRKQTTPSNHFGYADHTAEVRQHLISSLRPGRSRKSFSYKLGY